MSLLLGGKNPAQLTVEQRRTLRLAHLFLLTLLCIAAAFVVLYLVRSEWISAAVVGLAMMIGLLCLYDMRRTGQSARASHMTLLTYIIATVLSTITLDNYATPAMWLTIVPLMAGTLLGRRAAAIWSGIALLNIWLVATIEPATLQTPADLHSLNLTILTITLALLSMSVFQENERIWQAQRKTQAELREVAGQLTRADERTRNALVTTLHESVLQELFALRLMLTAGKVSPDSQRRSLMQLDRIDQELRRITVSLHPAIPGGVQLLEALQQLARRAPDHLGITIQLSLPSQLELPEAIEKALFLTTRELLFNAARYSHTDRVLLRLESGTDHLSVVIEDSGVGFSPGSAPTGSGIGLRLCRERIENIGGAMIVRSTPGAGTRILLEIPLQH